MTTPPGIGQIVYLASCMLDVQLKTAQTMSDTPNQYSADLKVMNDQGGWDLSQITGQPGPPGEPKLQLREVVDPLVTGPEKLPALANSYTDIGKYWLINTYDEFGHVTDVTAWVWWGSTWRTFMMGTYGPPGPTPKVTPTVNLIPPKQMSEVATSGSSLSPSWEFNIAVPPGPSGQASPLALFSDVDVHTVQPAADSVLMMFNPTYPAVFSPVIFDQAVLSPYSMPSESFVSYSGVSQQAPVGSFELPPQPFDWTPIVWGHIGGSGFSLSGNPFMVGCQVLLGDPVAGIQIARGMGSTMGVVDIHPHYSSSGKSGNTTRALQPGNRYAVIPANHTNPSVGTIYVNLWNDGQTGVYTFSPTDAQVFVLVVPIDPPYTAIVEPG